MNIFSSNSFLAKILSIVLIVIATQYHTLAGLLVVLIIVSYNQSIFEGMTNSSKDSSPKQDFVSKNCKNGKLMKDGKEVSMDNIKASFPNIKFTNDSCNPCDDSCEFEIVSTLEQISVEENLRPKDSNEEPIDKKNNIKKMDE